MNSEQNNGYVRLNGRKGIYTMEEVINLLHDHGLKVRVILSAKGDYRDLNGIESPNLAEKEVR